MDIKVISTIILSLGPIVSAVLIAAVAIMKKIEPENKVYPFWALALAAMNMIVIIWG